MKTQWIGALIIGGTLFAGSAAAQYRDRYDRGGYDNRQQRADPVNRTLGDLRRAQSEAWAGNHERRNFNDAEKWLFRFQDRASRGRWDNHALDEAIEHVQNLVNANRVDPRDRETLARDLFELREFRANRGTPYSGADGYYRR